jgi:hypothetical protein
MTTLNLQGRHRDTGGTFGVLDSMFDRTAVDGDRMLLNVPQP